MEKKENVKKIGKVTLRTSPLALKVALTLLIIFSMGALTALRWVHLNLRQEISDMRQEAAAIETENEKLQDQIGALGSVNSIEDIAEEELGLVDPHTVLIDPIGNAE